MITKQAAIAILVIMSMIAAAISLFSWWLFLKLLVWLFGPL